MGSEYVQVTVMIRFLDGVFLVRGAVAVLTKDSVVRSAVAVLCASADRALIQKPYHHCNLDIFTPHLNQFSEQHKNRMNVL